MVDGVGWDVFCPSYSNQASMVDIGQYWGGQQNVGIMFESSYSYSSALGSCF